MIPAATIATFAGVFAVIPDSRPDAPPVAGEQAGSGPSTTGTAVDPLAPAATGRVECYEPDARRKTCEQIVTYKSLGGARYQAIVVSLSSSKGPVIMEFSMPVTVVAGEVCGETRRKDYVMARISVGGHVLSPGEAARVWAASEEALTPAMHRKVCTSYARSARGLIATNRWKVGKRRVEWMRPSNGYRVAA